MLIRIKHGGDRDMVVKIVFPRRGEGDQVVKMDLEDARREIELGIKNGYIPVYNGKLVKAEDLQDDQEIRMFPPIAGG
jgi:hypothetical protein